MDRTSNIISKHLKIIRLMSNVIYIFDLYIIMYFISNYSTTHVIEFPKEIYCPREVITVSTAIGTTYCLRPIISLCKYKSGLLQYFLSAKQTFRWCATRLKGSTKSAKISARFQLWKMMRLFRRDDDSLFSFPGKSLETFFVSNIEIYDYNMTKVRLRDNISKKIRYEG